MQEDSDTCSMCHRAYTITRTDTWTTDNGTPLILGSSDMGFAVVTLNGEEVEICEKCYLDGSLKGRIQCRDMYEVHYEFGLCFLQRERYEDALQAFKEAMEIGIDSKLLASIGLAYGYLGQHTLAKVSYQRALELDPSNFCAGSNLKLLLASENQ